jgi:ABC-2 type transport system ATP-binding protein
MDQYIVETKDLVHRFSDQATVLDHISMQVPEGSIYGFLGPNGAGKTTTLRLIPGLLKKQQGSISIFGKPLEKNRIGILQKLGSMIESPSIYAHLSATENLEVLQKIYRCPKARIREVLRLVDLDGTKSKKAGRFSLGMKQRLGIAIALLNDPRLLILDEPTNGLDPNGIIEIRELLKRLNQQQGTTIIISSHLLAEIEKLVTHVGIISKGKMMFQGTLQELISRQQQTSFVVLETNDTTRTLQLMNDSGQPAFIEDGKVTSTVFSKEKIAVINRRLVEAGVEVYGISIVKNDLEAIFMNLVK